MNSGKYAFCAPAALMRASISSTMRSQMAKPVGRITMVPRTGPLSASSALAIRSWYQRGKSSARGVSTRAMTGHPRRTGRDRGARARRPPRRLGKIEWTPVASAHHAAAQDDPARRGHHAEVGARVLVVHHQVGEAALDQSGEAEP